MQKMEKLKILCLQYAAAAQWLISSSVDIPKHGEASGGLRQAEKSKSWKSRGPSQGLILTTKNATVTDSIL